MSESKKSCTGRLVSLAIGGAVLLLLVALLNPGGKSSSTSDSDKGESKTESDAAPPDTSRDGLAIIVFNATERKPPAPRAEVWVQGAGSLWLWNEPTRQGNERWDLDLPKTATTVWIYPDGRRGGTDEGGCRVEVIPGRKVPADALTITIQDDVVEVIGEPLKRVGGEIKRTFPRRR